MFSAVTAMPCFGIEIAELAVFHAESATWSANPPSGCAGPDVADASPSSACHWHPGSSTTAGWTRVSSLISMRPTSKASHTGLMLTELMSNICAFAAPATLAKRTLSGNDRGDGNNAKRAGPSIARFCRRPAHAQ